MEEKKGAPAWMVSFGDMMTLILTFFILLVSLSSVQQVGLVASGVGSFLLAVRSFGLPGIMDASEQAVTFDNVRQRFNLPPEDDPEVREEHLHATDLEVLRAEALKHLAPHNQIGQPAVALFDPGSSTLSSSSKHYLDLLAKTLYPQESQTLVLEGHAMRAESGSADPSLLSFQRASAVRDYLVEEHSFPPVRVEARAWYREVDLPGPELRCVDARLVIPEH